MAYSEIKEMLIRTNVSTEKLPKENVTAIAVHYTAGKGGDAEGLKHSYETRSDQTNSHYGIGLSGQVIRFVPEGIKSWCTNNANWCTISIEACNKDKDNSTGEWTNETYDSLVQLTAELCLKYNINPLETRSQKVGGKTQYFGIIRHYEVTGKICPRWFVTSTSADKLDDIGQQRFEEFKQKVAARVQNGTSGGGGTLDTPTGRTKNYLYHPLGDYAKNLIDGNASLEAYAHTYANHGWGKCDWNPGPDLGVYSMTDGVITSVAKIQDEYAGQNRKGYYVIIKTQGMNFKGKDVYIRYIEMAGLTEFITSALSTSVAAGPNTWTASGTWTEHPNLPVKKGDQLGYTNDFPSQSDVHIDFTYRDKFLGGTIDFNDIKDVPNIEDQTLASNFSLKDGKIYKDNQILGNSDGRVPLINGSSSEYTTYPSYSYCIQLQLAEYINASCSSCVPGPDGGIPIISEEPIAYKENMNADAVNFYLNGAMSDRWIGKYPETLQDLNNNIECRGIRYAAAICNRELTFNDFSILTYGKLLRAKMIGETDKKGETMKEWFEKLNPDQFAGKSVWIAKTFSSENDLLKAQLVYKNIKYPNIYGGEYHEGTDLFKEKIVYACRQIPVYNLSPIVNKPLAFLVNFDYYKNKDSSTSGGGNYLMYRLRSGNVTGFNSKITQ